MGFSPRGDQPFDRSRVVSCTGFVYAAGTKATMARVYISLSGNTLLSLLVPRVGRLRKCFGGQPWAVCMNPLRRISGPVG